MDAVLCECISPTKTEDNNYIQYLTIITDNNANQKHPLLLNRYTDEEDAGRGVSDHILSQCGHNSATTYSASQDI